MTLDIDTLIAGVYDAALDASLWPLVLEAAARESKSTQSVLYTPEIGLQEGGFYTTHNIAPEYLVAYDARYRDLDAWTRAYNSKYGGQNLSVTSDMLLSHRELLRSEFYADFLRPQNLRHICCSIVNRKHLQGPTVALGIYRGHQHEDFSEEERLLWGGLTPHLQRAFLISERLSSVMRERRLDKAMLDQAATAIFLVDRSCRVLRLTETAERLAEAASHLTIRNGKLVTVVDSNLSDVVRAVAAQKHQKPFSKILTTFSHVDKGRIHLLVASAGMHLAESGFVVVGPLAGDPTVDFATRLKDVYQLTSAEIRLCRHLSAGTSIAGIAETNAVSRHTVQSQLKSIFQKTGTSRQSDLVRLLVDIMAL